ncbi:uncharacterized protein CANTADRAFT_24686 [Suhomyces tanzawaensis NRRL Y-17324]|uniref:VPS9 domain-containing protein n=1 Tax=Suhomyces tanzawaensis NRRL Y-17324 TaxID=984487 RepID=A0A1E4SRA8_9ASCO|nr:uncharacterized protein CANTADRAFT_24686 [Suhomyces tanzawaensis NRRL Y-17324]ODV81977.1 hypothetical protein CANTADRAFT_24686 [Suhomyces tanzawaensis NRRL Y-17324]
MSFSNPLAFNLSKSSPTTSTTNASIPSTANTTTDSVSGSVNQSSPKSPFLLNILAKKGSPADLSHSFDGGSSGAAPTVLTVGNEGSTKSATKDNNSKSELIDLFERFDVSGKPQNHDEESLIEDSSVEGEKKEEPEDQAIVKLSGDMEEKYTGSLVRPNKPVKNDNDSTSEVPGELKSGNSEKTQRVNEQLAEPEAKDTIDIQNLQAEKKIITGHSSANDFKTEKDGGNKSEDPRDSKVEEEDKHLNIVQPTALGSEDAESEQSKTNIPQETRSIDIPKTTSRDTQGNNSSFNHGDYTEKDISSKDISDISSSPFETGIEDYEANVSSAGEAQEVVSGSNDETATSSEEQYQQSHKPFDFQTFLAQLKHKSADPVVRYIRSFLVSFTRQGHTFSWEQRVKIVREFKQFMSEKFNIYEPFKSMDDIDLENSREGLEKLIMNRIYDHCFPPEARKQFPTQLPKSFWQDIEDDEALSLQLEKFSWVNGSHLDIDLDDLSKQKKGNPNFMDYAVTELSKINSYRAPRDKIICLLNACKIIFSFLKVSNQETNADSFVPLLILVLIKAKTENLISNVHYIENFRGEEWLLHGETSYYLSTLQGAIGFIQNLGIKELTIDEAEFNAHMEAWEAQQNQKTKFALAQPQPQHVQSALSDDLQSSRNPQQSLSPSNVLMTSAELFTKSISSFLSPSPQEGVRGSESEFQRPSGAPPTSAENVPTTEETEQMKQTYTSLKEMFPNLDKAVLKDIIFMNKGKIEESLDACLQLVNDV